MYKRIHSQAICYFIAASLIMLSCGHRTSTNTTFYYWKTSFRINAAQNEFLQKTNTKQLYVRFFDVSWNGEKKLCYPNAIIKFDGSTVNFDIVPVIYITNKTLENIADTSINQLALNCNKLVNSIAGKQHLTYKKVQIDCDWSLNTRNKYFNFLTEFKKLNNHSLQVTIRLHQVKYKDQSGIPPVDTGVLMFYNMGKLNGNILQRNSIYNNIDADKYIRYLKSYPLKLDIALPLFAWAIHIRNGKILQVYGNISRKIFEQQNFELLNKTNCYLAKNSLFLNGIYIKQNDIFKFEEMNARSLNTAAKQLSKYFNKQEYLTVIYYELSNINLSEFKAETVNDISNIF